MSFMALVAATATGPAHQLVLNDIPDHVGVHRALATNAAVPLDIATDLAFAAGHADWLVGRPDLDDGTRLDILLLLARDGGLLAHIDQLGTARTIGQLLRTADDHWFDAFVTPNPHAILSVSTRSTTFLTALTGIRHPSARIHAIMHAIEAAAYRSDDELPSAATRLLRAYPDVAVDIRDDPDRDPLLRYFAASALPLDLDTIPTAELVTVAACSSPLVDQDMPAVTWTASAESHDAAMAMLRRLDTEWMISLAAAVTKVTPAVSHATQQPFNDLVRWMATASPADLDATWAAAPDRTMQVMVDHPELRRRLLDVDTPKVHRAVQLLGPDIVSCLPLRHAATAAMPATLTVYADALDALDPSTAAAVITLGRTTGDATFADLVNAALSVR